MSVISINEPDTSRKIVLTPQSLNEPASLPEWALEPPAITAIEPAECAIGDESFTVYLSGTGFYDQSVIVFAGHDEPTTFADGQLSTGVNMDVWHGPDTVQVSVRNGPIHSAPVDFRFNAAELADPDDLEDEIEAAEEDGDFRPMHRSHVRKVKR